MRRFTVWRHLPGPRPAWSTEPSTVGPSARMVAAGRGRPALRNLYDQYSQAENRVTHALLSALNEDRRLLRLFLRELVKTKAPGDARKLVLLEQQYPGEDEPSEEELERRGVPDAWI